MFGEVYQDSDWFEDLKEWLEQWLADFVAITSTRKFPQKVYACTLPPCPVPCKNIGTREYPTGFM